MNNIVEVQIDDIRQTQGLDLGIDISSQKRVIIFQRTLSYDIEGRAYRNMEPLKLRSSEEEYELVSLTKAQENYCKNLIKQNDIWTNLDIWKGYVTGI